MGKMPAFQFYVGDWRRDTQVQMASMETRGVWIEMLCCMWDAPERGKLEGSIEQLSKLIGCETAILERSISELNDLKIADVTNGHKNVTIVNRRMSRDEKTRRQATLRKRSQRQRERSHATVTPPSSSSSSSSKKKPPYSPPKGTVDYPSWLDQKLWKDFKQHRQKLRKPMTLQAESRNIATLKRIIDKGWNQEQIVGRSIECGWVGLFEPKEPPPEKESKMCKDCGKRKWVIKHRCRECHAEWEKRNA